MKSNLPQKFFTTSLVIAALGAAVAFVGWNFMAEKISPALYAAALVFAFGVINGLIGLNMGKPKKFQTKTLFVGNLAFKADRNQLRRLFQPFGKVVSARIILDRNTRKPKGFGFVEIDASGASKAITDMNGKIFLGRELKVSIAADQDK